MSKLVKPVSTLLACGLICACASVDGPQTPRRQITECPDPLTLICEGQGEPSKGGAEEEIPNYDRCYCR